MTLASPTYLWFDPQEPLEALEEPLPYVVEEPAEPGVDRAVLVQGEQVRMAYGETRRALPSTVVPNLLAALMLVSAMWGEVPSAVLVGW
jgi:hypothetical protein